MFIKQPPTPFTTTSSHSLHPDPTNSSPPLPAAHLSPRQADMAVAPPPNTDDWTWNCRKIVLFGDSITQYAFSPEGGFGARLADRYVRFGNGWG